jgi:hypothetical protein
VPELQNLTGLGNGDANGIARLVHQHGAAQFIKPADFISAGYRFLRSALGLSGKFAYDRRRGEKDE